MDATPIWALLAGFGVALATTPAGVSGAVFLLPVQVGLLGVPNPAVTPTNLMFNVLATPGGLVRWARTGAIDRGLVRTLVTAALPGVAAGAVLRVTALSGRLAVLIMIGLVLTSLGAWLLAGRGAPEGRRPPRRRTLGAVAGVAGLVGGAYGIGGGSIIAPALVTLGLPPERVAPAALATTLATSVAGIALFELLAVSGAGSGPVGPRWATGLALGAGGAAGAYAGARLHGRLHGGRLRLLLGAVALAVGVSHLLTAGLDLV